MQSCCPQRRPGDWRRSADWLRSEQDYFLYFPQALYRYLGRVEAALAKVPLGGSMRYLARKHC